MKEEEMHEFGKRQYPNIPEFKCDLTNGDITGTPEAILYLLKQGFDLFNLIPEGIALDKTLTTKNK